MYTVERIPRMTASEKAKADIDTLSPDTEWVVFNTRHLATSVTTMSTIEAGIMIGMGKLKNSLIFFYFKGYLRLAAKGNTALTGDPYGIKVGRDYDYDAVYAELHDALVKFRDGNKDFIKEYHGL